MRNTQSSGIDSLRAVTAFLDDHADRLGTVAKSGARKSLDQVIANLQSHVATQAGSQMTAKGGSTQVKASRRALVRDHMAQISAIAKAALPGLPPASGLILPGGKLSSVRLLQSAQGMAIAAVPHTDVFVAAGLPVDFIAQLDAAAAALQALVTARTGSRRKRRGATQGVKDQLSAGRKLVNVLDTFVKSALKDDTALLAEWNLAKRVRNTAAHPTGGATPLAGLTSSGAGSPAPSVSPAPPAAPAQSTAPAAVPAAAQHTTG